MARIEAHRAAMTGSELGRERRRRVAEFRLQKTAETLLLERFASAAAPFAPALADTLAARATDPYAAAQQLIAKTIRQEYSNELA